MQPSTTREQVRDADLDQIDFFSPDIISAPHAVLARLRKERPVAKFRQPTVNRDIYLVTTHALVDQVFKDHERFSSQFLEMFTGGGRADAEATAILAKTWPEVATLVHVDEPDHTRLRSLVAKAFMPSRVQRMTGLIGASITALIDKFIARGECDFVNEFAVPLPINSIGAILGISPSYYEKLCDWTFAFTRRVGQMGTRDEQIADARLIVELKEFIAELVHDRQKHPKDDLLSDLVTARVDGQSPFSDLETLSTALMLIFGGAETTRSVLISGMARLTQNPAQIALLLEDMSLIPRAVEEVLRIDPPGPGSWRVAKQDIELAGMPIPKGALVMVRKDSAGRDETIFENPADFNILRPNTHQHLTFGMGIHYCAGFRLAREQLSQSFAALLTRLKDVRMIAEKSDLSPHLSMNLWCLRALQLGFTPGAPEVEASKL